MDKYYFQEILKNTMALYLFFNNFFIWMSLYLKVYENKENRGGARKILSGDKF